MLTAGLAIVLAVMQGSAPPVDIAPVPMRASCTAEANVEIDRGAAWLLALAPSHARRAFERAAEMDPDCAIAYWGQGASLFPVAGDPAPGAIDGIRKAAARARNARASAGTERLVVDALVAFAEREPVRGVPPSWLARAAAYRDTLCGPASQSADETQRLLCARAQLMTSTLPGDPASREALRLAGTVSSPPLRLAASLVVLRVEEPRSDEAGKALETVLASNVPSAVAQHLALRAAVLRGDWAVAARTGAAVIAAAGADPGELFLGTGDAYAPEWLLETRLQQGQLAQARADIERAQASLDAVEDGELAARLRAAVLRMRARLHLHTRPETPFDGGTGEDEPAWIVPFVQGLDAAIRAWPGGNPARLSEANRALDRLESLLATAGPASELAWARALVGAAMAASQDEHPQMTLFFEHAVTVEDRLRTAGQQLLPLVPARELAAELWLRTYGYQQAQRQARAARDVLPGRALPYAIIARAAVRLQDQATARAAYQQVQHLRRAADPGDALAREAAAFLTP